MSQIQQFRQRKNVSNFYEYYLTIVLPLFKLENEVVVTRKGQTTIPVKLRRKYNIEEGTRLEVVDTNDVSFLKEN